ncbi:MAG: rhodanese-like domain-containing protein [Lachnospiraceae bacterium]|nr:rhodanese-like domain-containing protein [Lachnospiraceae bacterium]
MNIFDFFKGPDINQGVSMYKDTKGAVLIDVREQDEYGSGHIPGSKNVPLSSIGMISNVAPDKNTPLFVYCLSGGRSSSATSALVKMGYTTVNNIGGISGYTGPVEH